MKDRRRTFPRTHSSKPRKQRRAQFNAPKHRLRRMMSCRLSDAIGQKSGKFYPRSLPLVKGDVVRVMRGEYRGLKKKVNKIDRKKRRAYVEGAVYTKADGTKIPRPIDASNLVIEELNLNDPRRREIIERARRDYNVRFGESPDKDYSEEPAEEDSGEEAEGDSGEEAEEDSEEEAEEDSEEEAEEDSEEEAEEDSEEEAEEDSEEEAEEDSGNRVEEEEKEVE